MRTTKYSVGNLAQVVGEPTSNRRNTSDDEDVDWEKLEEDIDLLSQHCRKALAQESLLTYGELADITGWKLPYLNIVLHALGEKCHLASVPFLTSAVVSSGNGTPSYGYWRDWRVLRQEHIPQTQQRTRWLIELGRAIQWALDVSEDDVVEPEDDDGDD